MKIEKEKGKLEEYEEELKVAEKELERIQESLKGAYAFPLFRLVES